MSGVREGRFKREHTVEESFGVEPVERILRSGRDGRDHRTVEVT